MGTADAVAVKPERTEEGFRERFNQGDVDGALTYFEPDAAAFSPTGEVPYGGEAVRALMAGLMAPGLTLTGTSTQEAVREDIALHVFEWQIRGLGPEGEPVEHTGKAAVVFRPGDDGVWRIAIDHPFVA